MYWALKSRNLHGRLVAPLLVVSLFWTVNTPLSALQQGAYCRIVPPRGASPGSSRSGALEIDRCSVFGVQKGAGTDYTLTLPGAKRAYETNDLKLLVERVREEVKAGDVDSILIEGNGFSYDEGRAFLATLRLRQKALDLDLNFALLTGPERSHDIFFSRATKFHIEATRPSLEISTPSGYPAGRLELRRSGYRASVTVFGKTKEVVARFLELLAELLSTVRPSRDPSLMELVLEAKKTVRKEFGLSDEALQIELRDEFETIHLVEVRNPTNSRG